MSTPRRVQVVALLACCGLIFAASRLVPGINEGRKKLTTFGDEAEIAKNTPPEYAFFVQAFGAFRSLLTNIAFLRAENYKEQGRYFDAVELGNWICTLQPRFPSVWEFVSWNQAWNISVTTYTPQERWNWVYNGAKLLRDQGIPLNPRALNLYKQLAWIYNNKMGEMVDDYHYVYKCNWAWRMHLIFGAPPEPVEAIDKPGEFEPVGVADDQLMLKLARLAELEDAKIRERMKNEPLVYYVDRKPPTAEQLEELDRASDKFEAQVAKRAAYDEISKIAQAPDKLKDLMADPEAAAIVSRLRRVGVILRDDPLTEDDYWNEGGLAWTFFKRYRKLVDPPSILLSLRRGTPLESAKESDLSEFRAALGGDEFAAPAQAVYHYLQKKVLREVYKLDLSHMQFCVREFGALDWRCVDAHSLYWVTLSLIKGGETLSTFQNDRVNTARLMFFSVRNLFSRGDLTFEPDPANVHMSYIDTNPNLNFVDAMHRAFVRYGSFLDPKPEEGGGVGFIYRVGHVNFLTEAICLLYIRGREAEAMHYYRYLANAYGRKPDGELQDNYARPLHDFAMARFYDSLANYRDAYAAISEMLSMGYEELSRGKVSRYNKAVERASELWNKYMEDKKTDLAERRKLPPFGDIQQDILSTILATPAPGQNTLINKVKLWRNLPLSLKQFVYDDLAAPLTEECGLYDFDAAAAFPMPAGMDEFRKSNAARAREERKRTAETTIQSSR